MSNAYEYHRVKNIVQGMLSGTQTDLIARLYALNVQAVNQRYGDDVPDVLDEKQLDTYSAFNPQVSVYQFLKSLECLHYQMSEGDIPETMEYQQLEHLIDAVYRAIVPTMPEYRAARWG